MLFRPRHGVAAFATALLTPLALLVDARARGVAAPLPPSPRQAIPTPTAPPVARPVPGKPGVYRLDPRLYIPTAHLTPGMKGYGLTVFQGAKIERFDVTVLGVLRKVNNGRDLILVRLGGNPNLNRVSDIIAGMSGSPVYVDGKIIGAVAYGNAFTRERIGYLTPIEDMLDAWDPALPQYPDGFGPGDRPTATDIGEPTGKAIMSGALADPVTVEGHRFTRLHVAAPGEKTKPLSKAGDTLMLRPLMTSVSVTGVPASRWARVSEALGKLGLDARQGVGGGAVDTLATRGAKPLAASPLQPGGGIAMSLATGDMDITGIGTLTFRANNRIVAFGHPFLSIGPIEAPMSTVYIHDILPSYNESTKIGSAVKQVGSFTQDRPFSIAGRIGDTPVMVPVRVRITDRSNGRSRFFHCNVVRHPQLTRTLAPMAAGIAISEVHSQPGDAMATVRTTVTADEIGTVSRVNRVYDPLSIDTAATEDLDTLAGILSANPFYPVPIRAVSLDVTIDEGRKTAQIERVFLDQTRYEPGDTVNVNVVLRPYKQLRVVKTIPVRIPATVPDGSVLTILVQGGGSASGLSFGQSEGGGLVLQRAGSEDYASAVNVRQLVRRFLDHERDDALVARLLLPSAAVSVQGERLPGLPPNIDSVLRGGTGSAGSRSSGVRLERDEVRASALSDYVLSGVQSISIRVARRGTPDTSTVNPAPSAAPAPTQSSSAEQTIPAAPPRSTGGLPVVSTAADDLGPRLAQASALLPEQGGVTGPVIDTGVTVVHVGPPQSTAMASSLAPAPVPTPTPTPASETGSVTSFPIGRMPQVWRQASAADFRSAALLDGVTVSSNGDVSLAPRLTKVAESVVDPYYWCLAPDPKGGGVFAGTGDGGVIYRVAADGAQTVYARTGELEVQSLATAPDGTLYAGTAPHGYIFRVTPDGKVTPFFQAKEKYILALSLTPDGKSLYAGVGGPSARVYRVPLEAGGKPEVAYESAEGSVTALASGADGTIYAGTAPSSLIVKVAGPGVDHPAVLYDAAESAVTGLAVAKDAPTLYVTTMSPGRGVLYTIDAVTGAASVLYDRSPENSLTGLQRADDGTLYTASGSTLVAIRPSVMGGTISDADIRTFEASSNADIQILSVLLGSDGQVWASTGNTGGVYRLAGGVDGTPATGQLVSRVFDARAASHWGTIRWTATLPTGATLFLQTRTGDVPQPDNSWSDWSRAYGTPTGDTVVSPPGRYMQYRATLTGQGTSAPLLRSVEAFYLPPNQAPRLVLTTPMGGEVWRGTKTLRWSAIDPDKDTLSYTVSVSGDGGKTWRPVNGAMTSTPGSAGNFRTTTVGGATIVQGRAALEAELANHPEITPEMRARILADIPPDEPKAPATPVSPSSIKASAPTSTDSGTVTRSTSLNLDTTKLPDGVYVLKVVASDKPSNPTDALAAEKVSGEFRVVNRVPRLVLFKSGLKVNPDRTVHLEGVAMQAGATVRGVQYRIDGGDWMAAAASDGLFDSTLESFTLTTPALSPGSHTLDVQTQDEAGNSATQSLSVGG